MQTLDGYPRPTESVSIDSAQEPLLCVTLNLEICIHEHIYQALKHRI